MSPLSYISSLFGSSGNSQTNSPVDIVSTQPFSQTLQQSIDSQNDASQGADPGAHISACTLADAVVFRERADACAIEQPELEQHE
jgi:hypothetical protein